MLMMIKMMMMMMTTLNGNTIYQLTNFEMDGVVETDPGVCAVFKPGSVSFQWWIKLLANVEF